MHRLLIAVFKMIFLYYCCFKDSLQRFEIKIEFFKNWKLNYFKKLIFILTLWYLMIWFSIAKYDVLTILFSICFSVTNLFLVNLSVADLLVTLLCMPAQIARAITVVWDYGEVMCKVYCYMQGKLNTRNTQSISPFK